MRGEVGEPITITIVRGTEKPFDIEIKRDIIKVQSVKHRVINNVGVLRISTFNEQTTVGLKKSIEELEGSENPPIGYVLDLRNNRKKMDIYFSMEICLRSGAGIGKVL